MDPKIILVIDWGVSANFFSENSTYRPIPLRGCTYTEENFRKWVSKTWGVSADSSLEVLAEQAKQWGWICLKALSL